MTEVSTRPHKSANSPKRAEAVAIPPPPSSPPHTHVGVAFDRERLHDLLEHAKTVSDLLAHNFGGDGAFDEPSKAPGLAGLVECVTNFCGAAHQYSAPAMLNDGVQQAILQAHSLAEHLEALSSEELFEGRGFRIGDRFVSMCYWTIGKLTQQAIDGLEAHA